MIHRFIQAYPKHYSAIVFGLKFLILCFLSSFWQYIYNFEFAFDFATFLIISVYFLTLIILSDVASSRIKNTSQKIIITLLFFGLLGNFLHVVFFALPIEYSLFKLVLQPLSWGAFGGVNTISFIYETWHLIKMPFFVSLCFLFVFLIPPFAYEKSLFSSKLFALPFFIFTVAAWHTPKYLLPPMYTFYTPFIQSFLKKDVDFSLKKNVGIQPSEPLIKNIILIIDESVNGEFLSINNKNKKTTPFLEELVKEKKLINYGIGCSATNYSTSNDALIRFGADMHALKNKRKKHTFHEAATIFQYAKKAGFQTIYADSQVFKGSLNSYMTTTETQSIDQLFQRPFDADMKKIDFDMLQHIEKTILTSDTKKFIIIRKNGSHSPFHLHYPKENYPGSCDTSLCHYENIINWSVDYYFQKLLPILSLNNTIIIYVSDHGFSHDASHYGYGTVHEPKSTEAMIPFLIITENTTLFEKFSQNKNPKSSFQIFPTLLELLGYTKKDIAQITKTKPLYEDEQKKEMVFFSGDLFSADQNNYNINRCFTKN